MDILLFFGENHILKLLLILKQGFIELFKHMSLVTDDAWTEARAQRKTRGETEVSR